MMAFVSPSLVSVGFALVGVSCFVTALFVASRLVPGRDVEVATSDGGIIRYRFNGLVVFAATLVLATASQRLGLDIAVLARHLWSIFLAVNLLAWTAAIVLVLYGPGKPGLSGFFYGTEKNPRLWGVDLKMFSYRPSLIGLALMNASFAALQFETTGSISRAMGCYQVLTLIYIANYFQFEQGMLFTWDIIEEKFGWMLIWGDYVLVPFFYSMPAAYVLLRQDDVSPAFVALVAVLYVLGFWIFRGANGQKHRFKSNPSQPIWGKAPRTVGGRLLVSGFWGIGRKLNYTGEFLMYLSWTLLAGFASGIPYLLPAWLLVLLMQRASRDDRRCRQKYGSLWDDYCRIARFRMFPFIY